MSCRGTGIAHTQTGHSHSCRLLWLNGQWWANALHCLWSFCPLCSHQTGCATHMAVARRRSVDVCPIALRPLKANNCAHGHNRSHQTTFCAYIALQHGSATLRVQCRHKCNEQSTQLAHCTATDQHKRFHVLFTIRKPSTLDCTTSTMSNSTEHKTYSEHMVADLNDICQATAVVDV